MATTGNRKRRGSFNWRNLEVFILGTAVALLAVLNVYWLGQYARHHEVQLRSDVAANLSPKASQLQKYDHGVPKKGISRVKNEEAPRSKKLHRKREEQKKEVQRARSLNQTKKDVLEKNSEDIATVYARNVLQRAARQRNAKKRKPGGFNHRRSKYNPPEDYIADDLQYQATEYWTSHAEKRASLSLNRTIPYLGVLIDAGRHYFDLDWLYQILDILYLLQYNWVHFRLTDDQAFNLRLDSWPQLAVPTPMHHQTKVYTPDQLRKLVHYAKDRNITMIPEINVPGHAGAWAGVPGLVVPCPEFACSKGYGLPLNTDHPQLPQILKDVLSEVLDVFDNPPYLHLGGDEVELSRTCFEEIRQPLPDFTKFENLLRQTLQEIDYDESKVIRWESMSGNPKGKDRTGRILQWWFQIPGRQEAIQTRPGDPLVGSSGLYMDANDDAGAWEIFLHARKFQHLSFNYTPMALVVGTFELDQEFWFDRNVLGRLVAVALGASKDVQVTNGTELFHQYRNYCSNVLQFPDATCTKYAKPNLQTKLWKEPKWKAVMWRQLREGLCERLTVPAHPTWLGSPTTKRLFREELLIQ